MIKDVREFHMKFGMSYDGPPRQLPDRLSEFRVGFMQEELNEYVSAVVEMDLPGQLDALVDLVYVALGTAYLHGFNLPEAWRRVHAANLKKTFGADPKRGFEVSKVVKADGWVPPVLKDLI